MPVHYSSRIEWWLDVIISHIFKPQNYIDCDVDCNLVHPLTSDEKTNSRKVNMGIFQPECIAMYHLQIWCRRRISPNDANWELRGMKRKATPRRNLLASNQQQTEAAERDKDDRVLSWDNHLAGMGPLSWLPKRYVLSVMVFWGFFTMYALRVNLNVAIGGMVHNHTVVENGETKLKVGSLQCYTVYSLSWDPEICRPTRCPLFYILSLGRVYLFTHLYLEQLSGVWWWRKYIFYEQKSITVYLFNGFSQNNLLRDSNTTSEQKQ